MEYHLADSDEKSGLEDEIIEFDEEEILYFSDHESSGFLDNNDYDGQSDQPVDLKRYRKRETIQSRVAKAYHSLTFANIKKFLQWLMDTASLKFEISFEDVTLLMTIFVLFGDDIELLAAPSSDDDSFQVAYSVCLFAFIFELIANTWGKTEIHSWIPFRMEGFLFSFFWWLEIVAIISLFPDIKWIGGPMQMFGITAKVGSANIYSKVGRVARMVRLVRLVRVYKVAAERRRRVKQEQELLELVHAGVIEYEEVDKYRKLANRGTSRLGDQLSESTIHRVIVMILIMIIVVPVLEYAPDNNGRDFASTMLQAFNTHPLVGPAAQQTVLNTFVSSFKRDYNNRYVCFLSITPMTLPDPYINYYSYINGLRPISRQDVTRYNEIEETPYITEVVFSLVDLVRETAQLSIVMTIFVAIMLIGGSLVLTADAQRLVIAPIERMMNMVEAVASDPLATFTFDNSSKDGPGQYETRLLETSIQKITALLRVGFGEAGAGIISANLKTRDSSATIDPLLPGVRVYAIFGFCGIHNFQDINQKLGNDVLVFVNRIAEIVHSSVHAWSGQCNKNLGNAFVIVWRIGDQSQLSSHLQANRLRTASAVINTRDFRSDSVDSEVLEELSKTKATIIDLRRVPGVDKLADQALIGYCKIIAEINRNKYVMRYRNEPKLTDQGKQEFKVRMGFGMHAGWAIEGAVGSVQKVDATYLSPHVNMAARLETASKQYHVPLLASQDFVDLLSAAGQVTMRRLDVVTVKGSEVPTGIYTYDALQDQVFLEDKQQCKQQRGSVVSPTSSSSSLTRGVTGVRNLFKRSSTIDNENTLNNDSGTTQNSTIPGNITHIKTTTNLPSKSMFDMSTIFENRTNSPTRNSPLSGMNSAFVTSTTNSNVANPSYSPGMKRRNSSPVPFVGHEESEINSIGVSLGRAGTPTRQRRPSVYTMTPPGADKPISFLTSEANTEDVFELDYDMLTLRSHATDFEFVNIFREGVNYYLAGDWRAAQGCLERADAFMKFAAPSLGGDGPSQTLLSYMEEYNFQAPVTWKGFRPLTSK